MGPFSRRTQRKRTSWPGRQSRRSEGGAAWPHSPSLHQWLGEEGEPGRLVPLGKRLQGSRTPPQMAHHRVPRRLHWNPLSQTSTPSWPSDDQDPTELLEEQVHLSKMPLSTGEHLLPALPVWLPKSPNPFPAPEGPFSGKNRQAQTTTTHQQRRPRRMEAPHSGSHPRLLLGSRPLPVREATTSQQHCKTRQQPSIQAETTKLEQLALQSAPEF